MNHPYLFIIAIGIFGYLAPKILGAFGNFNTDTLFNVVFSAANMLIAYALVC